MYEIGNSGQYIDPESGETVVNPFEKVAELLDQKIKEIEAETWANEPSVLYLTGDRKLTKSLNKKRKREGLPEVEFKPNFRFEEAKKKEYKAGANRNKEKPFHYNNIREYMLANYECVVAEGFEADDLLSIHQRKRIKELDTIICSRDKDLRITPGLHFSWQCGRQEQWGPVRVTELGELELKGGKKLVGNGLKFFYSQVIMGDTVDNIPGLPRGGPVLAFNTLNSCETEREMFDKVSELYKKVYGDTWREEMKEQMNLTWMVQELTDEGEPVLYVMPDQREIEKAA